MDRSILQQLPRVAEEYDFLHPSFVRTLNRLSRFEEQVVEAFIREQERIRASVDLQHAAREIHRQLFSENGNPAEANKRLLAMGPDAGMFAALVYLSGLPALIERYALLGIGEDVLADTLDDVRIWMNAHRNKYGQWGLSQLGWIIRHMTGRLFRLGRLQFMAIPYAEKVRVYRHRVTGEVRALSADGVRFRSDGQVDGTNGSFDASGAWTAHFEDDGTTVTGHMLHPAGYAVRERIAMPRADWELVLAEGDTVLDVHIPEGSPMTYELCRDSYRRASTFWSEHFPETEWKAFVCSSWLLGPQLRELLPASSNIVRFQSDYHIIPILADDGQTFERVFGGKPANLSELPRDTSLRRTVLEHVSAGKPIHGAAGFILRG